MLKVSRIALVFAAMAFASCVQDDMNEGSTPETPGTEVSNNLTTVKLASFKGDAGRVSYAGSRAGEVEAEPGTLELVATIANPSKAEGFNFTSEGRWLSATSIYYNEETETYYVTYHMQGNNYNTELETDTAGAIQSFKINESGEVELGDGFRAQNPSAEDFDFNHIYFDGTSNRIIAAGHNVLKGNRKNTNAVIGVFDPVLGTYKYTTVKTAEKDYDAEGKSLGYKDAGNVNCVLRTNDVPDPIYGERHGWNLYYVATRKGMAVLSAYEDNLFQPALTKEGINYFIATPGSAKYISPTGSSSYYGLLYLTEDYKADTGNDITAATSSPAKIAHLSTCTSSGLSKGDMSDWGHLQSWNSPTQVLDPQNLEGFLEQEDLPESISPVDGKNTLAILGGGGSEIYAALGKNGMYYKSRDAGEGVKTFGNRPVNCIAVDLSPYRNATKGFLYVANGSKITILNNYTLAEVASYNAPALDEDGNDNPSSANFITVRRVEPDDNSSTRYIAVAFGQAGVKVFKFTPAN